MQDVRIRTGACVLLSVVAFASIPGAAAALLWWLIFTPALSLIKSRVIVSTLLLIGFFSIIMELTTGGGASYFFRMTVIILIGAWLLHEQQDGDFLKFGTWLLGKRTGFELGMIAEMGLLSLESLQADVDRIRTAMRLKGIPWSVQSIIPTGIILIYHTLARAEETAEVLAIRGYTCGGSMTPAFITTRKDIIAGFFCLCAVLIAVLPVSEFFILY